MKLKLTGLKLRMGTFFWCLQLSTFGDFDRLCGLIAHAFRHIFDFGDDVHALQDLSEDNVLPIQPPKNNLSVILKEARHKKTHEVTTVVIKNCEPLVSFPELAILSMPGLLCFSLKFSSGNLAP